MAMRAFYQRYRRTVWALAAFLFWIAVWALLSAVYGMDFVLPSPVTTVRDLLRAVTEPDFWGAILTSVFHIWLGFGIAAALGILLAFAGIRFRAVRVLFEPFCSVIRAVPVASFIVLVLVMLPSRMVSTVISALMGFPLIYSSAVAGLDTAPTELLEAGRLYRFGFFRTLRVIYFPHIRPILASALAVASGLCFKSGVAAEVIGIPRGSVGAAIYQTKVSFDMPRLFSYTAVIVLLSVLTEKLLVFFLAGRKQTAKATREERA